MRCATLLELLQQATVRGVEGPLFLSCASEVFQMRFKVWSGHENTADVDTIRSSPRYATASCKGPLTPFGPSAVRMGPKNPFIYLWVRKHVVKHCS